MKFLYQVRTKEGDIKTGVIEASSKEAAISMLQNLGYLVTYLEEERPPFYARELEIFQKVSLKDLFIFSRQLSILLNSKVTLVESLKTIIGQIKNQKLKRIISKVTEEVEAGSFLSKALSKYPEVFSSFFVTMIRAGETVGKLSQTTTFLADYLEREYTIRGRIKTAMVYPSLVLLVFFGVLGLMIFSVFPSFEQIIKEREIELPYHTKIILSLSQFVREKFWILFSIFGITIFGLIIYSKTKEGKEFFDKISLKIPFFGEILRQSILARIAQNLSTLTSAGLTLSVSLEIIEEMVGNEVYKKAISKIKEGIKKGESISSIASLYPELFPSFFNQLVLVGEKTGTLSDSLLTIFNFYQMETQRSIENFLRILEPLLIVIMGVLVGGLISSILLPLYRMIGA